MVARVGDLVDDAQAQAWALIQPLPGPAAARGDAAETEARAQIAAWPALAKASALALRAVPLPEQDRGGSLAVLAALTAIASRADVAAPTENAHPRLTRMTHVLGATADLLQGEPVHDGDRFHDAVALHDRISAAVETAATNTAAYCDVAHTHAEAPVPPHELTYLIATLRGHRTTPPDERTSSLDDVSRAAPGDTSLVAAVQAWQRQARATLIPTEAAQSSSAVRGLAGDLALLSRTTATTLQAGAAAGVIDKSAATAAANELDNAVHAWAAVDRGWLQNPRVVSGGAPSPGQDAARRSLHAAVTRVFRAKGTWLTVDELAQRPDIQRLTQDARRTAGALAQIGHQYETTVDTLVRSEALLAPARGLAAELEQTPASMLRPINRGHWIPVPADSSTAKRLSTTTHGAAQASSTASVLTDVAVRPPHASAGPVRQHQRTAKNHAERARAQNQRPEIHGR